MWSSKSTFITSVCVYKRFWMSWIGSELVMASTDTLKEVDERYCFRNSSLEVNIYSELDHLKCHVILKFYCTWSDPKISGGWNDSHSFNKLTARFILPLCMNECDGFLFLYAFFNQHTSMDCTCFSSLFTCLVLGRWGKVSSVLDMHFSRSVVSLTNLLPLYFFKMKKISGVLFQKWWFLNAKCASYLYTIFSLYFVVKKKLKLYQAYVLALIFQLYLLFKAILWWHVYFFPVCVYIFSWISMETS